MRSFDLGWSVHSAEVRTKDRMEKCPYVPIFSLGILSEILSNLE